MHDKTYTVEELRERLAGILVDFADYEDGRTADTKRGLNRKDLGRRAQAIQVAKAIINIFSSQRSPTPQEEECKHESDGWLINGNGAYRSCKKCYEIIEEVSHDKPSPASLPKIEPLTVSHISDTAHRDGSGIWFYPIKREVLVQKLDEIAKAVNHLQELSGKEKNETDIRD